LSSFHNDGKSCDRDRNRRTSISNQGKSQMILKMLPSFALIACCLLSGIPPKTFAQNTPEIKEGILRKEVKAQVLERKRTVTVRRILEHFPCTDCHEKLKPFTKPFRGKDLGEMTHENLTFQHMEEIRECTFCHSIIDPDRLHLLNGERITFEQVPDLCGQCHGIRFNEWNMGLHGEESGTWNGPRSSLSCTECHRPRFPRWKQKELRIFLVSAFQKRVVILIKTLSRALLCSAQLKQKSNSKRDNFRKGTINAIFAISRKKSNSSPTRRKPFTSTNGFPLDTAKPNYLATIVTISIIQII
jgi:hypothetical protein